jgi:UDP-3-O-[3-hydroxymyristoyl] glucosamine N-acyltransferase
VLSQISDKAIIHETAWISPENVIIEDGVKIGPSCVIGVDGINVERTIPLIGRSAIKQSKGRIIIKKNTQMTAFCVVEYAVEKDDFTTIGENVIMGPYVGIGHDSSVGENTIMVSSVSLMGHVKIGCKCWIGPNVTLRNRIEIGDEAYISMGSVVTQNVGKGKHVTGNFAIDHEKFIEHIKKIS